MAKIPDINSLGPRPMPDSGRPVYRPPQNIMPAIMAQAGSNLQEIGQKAQAGEDEFYGAAAKSQWLRSNIEAENAFNNDQDYSTFADRYQQTAAENLENALSIVQNPRQRAMLQQSLQVDMMQSLQKVKNLADTKRQDYKTGYILDTAKKNNDAALQSADPLVREQLIRANEAMIDSAVSTGDMSHTKAAEWKLKNSEDYGKTWLKLHPAEDQVKILSGEETVTIEDYTINNKINETIKLEGGYRKRDGGGLPSNYGISKKTYPNEDIENMTKERARFLYKRDFWDANNIDALPKNMRAIAFDFYVNGADKDVLGMTVNQMVERSNGDPAKLIEFRQKYYNQLVRINPDKYGPELEGWTNRLKNLAKMQRDTAEIKDKDELISFPKTNTPVDFIPIADRITLRDAAVADQASAIRAQNLMKEQKDKETQNDFLGRFYENKLKADDVNASDLPAFGAGGKKDFIDMLRDGPKSGNPRLHSELYQSVLTGVIDDPSDLVPYLALPDGQAISVEQAQNLTAAMNKGPDEATKAFLVGAKPQITGSNDLLGIRDPNGDSKYSAMLFELDRALSAGRKKGKSSRELLDPTSSSYIGKGLISSYSSTAEEKIQATIDTFSGDKNKPSPSNPPTGYQIPYGAIEKLRLNPSTAPQFEKHFGLPAGAAQEYIK